MVREAATSLSRVVCVVALAGAGKTAATHAVDQVFAHAGIGVPGAAPSGVAAEQLQDETAIPATTLHRLLDDARGGRGLPSGSVLVVDEARMAETRVLAPILELVEQANGKAISRSAIRTSFPQSGQAGCSPGQSSGKAPSC